MLQGFAKHRIEALVDGIFAIAMTILILEVKVPVLLTPGSGSELWGRLAHDGPTIAAYFFSFALLGMFWAWHHRLSRLIVSLDVPLVAISLCFLSLVSFFPFAAGLLGRYPLNPVSLAVYLPLVGLLLGCQVATLEMARHRGKLDPDAAPEVILRARKRNLRGLGIFMLANVPSALRAGWETATICCSLGAGALFLTRRLR